MSAYLILRMLAAFTLAAMAASCAHAAAASAPVVVLTIDGAITPAASDYASRGIAHAVRDGAQLVVLDIDTPGGLDTSMRSIIKAILSSPVPVASYVAPSGARAASAGTYILYASHIAAMAPGTNLGAATPVQIGAPSAPEPQKQPASPQQKDKEKDKDKADAKAGKQDAETPTQQPMTRKQINDAAAYIRGLAQMRGRNAEWAEQAVREAVSLSAAEALKLHVIDYVANDLTHLLKQLDGRRTVAQGQEKLLHTDGAPIVRYEPDWRVKLLAVITDPSIALLLLAGGIYGLLFEFLTPGMVLPGVLGAISLLLALYALQLLPVNYAGLALILLGLGFMVSEVFMPSFGALGVGGIIAFVIGAVILIDTEMPGFGIPIGFIVTVAVLCALLIAAMVGVALRTRRRMVVTGADALIGAVAEVVEADADGGWARVHGENWRVWSKSPLRLAQKVRVVARNGLVLEVAPVGNIEIGE